MPRGRLADTELDLTLGDLAATDMQTGRARFSSQLEWSGVEFE